MRMLVVLALLAAVMAVSATAARSPRLEKLAPNAADTATAKQADVKLSDLVSGWTGGTAKPNTSSAPDCPGQDYSPFTLTGAGETSFTHSVARIVSLVEVFPSHAQAIGDFHVDGLTGTAECEGAVFRKAFGAKAKLVSAKEVTAPSVGDTAIAFQIAVKVGANTFYVNVIEFVRGRTIGALITLNPTSPLVGRETLVRLMDARLQSDVA
jgi:hypothetical protein